MLNYLQQLPKAYPCPAGMNPVWIYYPRVYSFLVTLIGLQASWMLEVLGGTDPSKSPDAIGTEAEEKEIEAQVDPEEKQLLNSKKIMVNCEFNLVLRSRL